MTHESLSSGRLELQIWHGLIARGTFRQSFNLFDLCFIVARRDYCKVTSIESSAQNWKNQFRYTFCGYASKRRAGLFNTIPTSNLVNDSPAILSIRPPKFQSILPDFKLFSSFYELSCRKNLNALLVESWCVFNFLLIRLISFTFASCINAWEYCRHHRSCL